MSIVASIGIVSGKAGTKGNTATDPFLEHLRNRLARDTSWTAARVEREALQRYQHSEGGKLLRAAAGTPEAHRARLVAEWLDPEHAHAGDEARVRRHAERFGWPTVLAAAAIFLDRQGRGVYATIGKPCAFIYGHGRFGINEKILRPAGCEEGASNGS